MPGPSPTLAPDAPRADIERQTRLPPAAETSRTLHLVRGVDAPTLRAPALASVASVVARSTTLVTLNLVGHRLDRASVRALARAAAASPSLRVLDLGECGVDDDGATAVADAILLAPRLSRLHLDRNAVGPVGFEAIASAVRVGGCVRALDLSRNPGGDAGVIALARAAKEARERRGPDAPPRELTLRGCGVGDEGALAMGEAMRACEEMREVHLDGNQISAEARAALVETAESGWLGRIPRVFVEAGLS